MNWEAIGAIGQIIGSIAVVVSLLFVAFQMRQNNKVLKVGTYQDFVARNIHVSEMNARYADAIVKVRSGADATPAEHLVHINLMSATLRSGDALFYQYENGLIDNERLVSALKGVASGILDNPLNRQIWDSFQERYAAAYRSAINARLAELTNRGDAGLREPRFE